MKLTLFKKYIGFLILILTPIHYVIFIGKRQYINGEGDALYIYYFLIILGAYLYFSVVDVKKGGIIISLGIGFGSIFMMMAIRHYKEKYMLNQINKFPARALGIVTNNEENYKGKTKGIEIDYYYIVGEIKYEKTVRENLNFNIGDTLQIQYDKKEPHFHKILNK